MIGENVSWEREFKRMSEIFSAKMVTAKTDDLRYGGNRKLRDSGTLTTRQTGDRLHRNNRMNKLPAARGHLERLRAEAPAKAFTQVYRCERRRPGKDADYRAGYAVRPITRRSMEM